MFAVEDQAVLVWQGRQFDWDFTGYSERATPLAGPVEVLTPRPIVAAFRSGLGVEVHWSVRGSAGASSVEG